MEAQCVHNASEQIARAELEACTARVMFQIGFSHASESSVDILSDLTRKYIQKMCATLRWVSEHCGRTEVSMGDVEYAYRQMNINVDEMNDYMNQVRNYMPLRVLPHLKSNVTLRQFKSRNDLPSPNRHPDFPSWVPTTCTSYNSGKPSSPRESKNVAQLVRAPALPDFSDQNAISLGLCKLKKHQDQGRNVLTQRPLYHNQNLMKRTQSSCSVSQPPSRPLSRISVPKTEVESDKSHSPDVDLPISNTPSVPMFKRRLIKRRSDETPTPPLCAPSPSALGKIRSDHFSVLDILQNASSCPVSPAPQSVPAPAASHPLLTQNHAITKTQPNSCIQHGSLLTVASDLISDPGGVVSAALAGRSAPSLPPPVAPIPRNSMNLYEPPEVDEQPTRLVQMAILRHLFTLDSNLPVQLSQAFNQIAGHREKSPAQEHRNKPIYHIVRSESSAGEEPVRVLPPLKIRISRGFEEGESVEPSPVSVISHSPTDTDDSDDGIERKRRHKKKKKKKKKHKQMDEADLDSSQPSPCEIKDDGGGIRLKIRLRPPSRPSSNAS